MEIDGLHPIVYVDDPHAERDFYAAFGFQTTYEGAEFPGFVALSAGRATFAVSQRDNGPRGGSDAIRWQFTVRSVDDIAAVCESNGYDHEVITERGGDMFRTESPR